MADGRARVRPRSLPWVLAVVVAAGLGVVFGRWAFVAPQVDESIDVPATVRVAELTVGRSLPVPVSAVWDARPFGVGAAVGVLTSVDVADGGSVNAGDRLYSVGLRPVVAAVGEVPAFRDLFQGAKGADVAQVQRFLAGAGFLTGEADGDFDPATATAVRAWQKSLGVERDGVVRAADIVFASALPARVQVADGFGVGARVTDGDAVLSLLDGEPAFVATVPAGVSVDAALPIEVAFGDESVTAVVAGSRDDQSGNRILTLTREDGSSVCGDRCDLVPLDPAEAVFDARQVVTPEVTGPGVPAAAVWFEASGEAYVVLPDGTKTPVTILGQGQGSVVLGGVEEGTVVVLADETTGTGTGS
ncbi:Peptidoglycan-binding domain 1 protein [Xylanimonas cellulosilytica DSM 15894]|uniref:Peptidoglycan-binding domain 1 protein n=1 Tax=Xylanimonas cellulosilytica (strain DSM 15894 / JCM 12276 / CECT 5975 / KCTC 9989 / LMG 20990 / NBRC 107835 / XIL07) TaxID=446471 RepID=D1BSC4_XYLCX|nr:peptidoglycan-binding domain-containing protein [Xylanimonas cellulosilytica]ACZ30616.1 Peptidoglycan-binding domain 1 protein [Xylanimonas cellulosilytica DSM 15894]